MSGSVLSLLVAAVNAPRFLAVETEWVPADIQRQFTGIDEITREFLVLSLDVALIRYRLPLGFTSPTHKDMWSFDPITIASSLSRNNQRRLKASFNGEVQINKGALWLRDHYSHSVYDLAYKRSDIYLADSPEFTFYSCIVVGALKTLLRFMDLRFGSPLIHTREFRLSGSGDAALYDRARANASWFTRTALMYESLGINVTNLLSEIKSVSHFFSLPQYKRHALMERFFLQIQGDIANSAVVERIRAQRIQNAVLAYSKFSGMGKRPVPRSRFIEKKAHQWLLSAYFEGSWLSFLEYLGEKPDSNDKNKIITKKTRVSLSSLIIAPEQDEPIPDEGHSTSSLNFAEQELQSRFKTSSDFWKQLIELHEQQTPGMRSLWGLVAQGSGYLPRRYTYNRDRAEDPYNPGLYHELINKELLGEIRLLYGRETSRHFPFSSATAMFPYARFCAHLEPALSFWNGVGLTIWFLTQGPYSRTDIPGMPDYYQKQLEQLSALDCPIDETMFSEFSQVKVARSDNGLLISFEIDPEEGTIKNSLQKPRRSKVADQSFEHLKEIYLRYFKSWSEAHFDSFWLRRCHIALQMCGDRLNHLRGVKGREPKPKEIVDWDVATTINEYFGGKLLLLFEALGEYPKFTSKTRNVRLIKSIDALVDCLSAYIAQNLNSLDGRLQDAFLELAVEYCILWEGRGRPPTRSFFDSRYYYQEICKFLGTDPQIDPLVAWELFSSTLHQVTKPALLH